MKKNIEDKQFVYDATKKDLDLRIEQKRIAGAALKEAVRSGNIDARKEAISYFNVASKEYDLSKNENDKALSALKSAKVLNKIKNAFGKKRKTVKKVNVKQLKSDLKFLKKFK